MKILFSLVLIMLSWSAFSQQMQDTTQPPYKRYPTLPALNLILLDSTTKYTKENIPKKKPVLLFLFNPECEHCQHEAEDIVAHKDDFKDIQIIMASFYYPLANMKAFAEKTGIAQLENVVVAKDPYYILPSFYGLHNFPYLAMYDKKGNLIQAFEGSLGVDKIIEAFHRSH